MSFSGSVFKPGLEALMQALTVEPDPSGSPSMPSSVFRRRQCAVLRQASREGTRAAHSSPAIRPGDEIVGATIFLAFEAASYISGHVVRVDAGLSIARVGVQNLIEHSSVRGRANSARSVSVRCMGQSTCEKRRPSVTASAMSPADAWRTYAQRQALSRGREFVPRSATSCPRPKQTDSC